MARKPSIETTTVGSYPIPAWLVAAPSEQALLDATRVVLATQEQAGIDVVCDGELYRFDINHPETTDVIDKLFLRGFGLFSPGVRATAWRRAGREVRALPHSHHHRSSVAAPARTLFGPRGFQPVTKRA
jgi:hypothetical protein